MSDRTNRFTCLQSWCPRCGKVEHVYKFIVNVFGREDNRTVMATYACPNCSDVVQIVVAGESLDNVAPRNAENKT